MSKHNLPVNAEDREFMSNRIRLGLVLYFSGIIIISLFILVFLWNPVQGSLTAIKSEKRFITGPDGSQTNVTIIKNSSSSSEKRTIVTTMKSGEDELRNETTWTRPLTGQAFNTDPEIVFTNPEIRLVMFSIFFGVIGASVHGIGSLTAWMSTRKLEAGWGDMVFNTSSNRCSVSNHNLLDSSCRVC